MFGIRTFLTLFLLIVVLIVGVLLQRRFATMRSPRPGLILPILSTIGAIILSIQNFLIAFEVSFSLPAFAAAVVIFIFYMVPSIVFALMYLDTRTAMEKKRQERARRNQAASRQQNLQDELRSRYQGSRRPRR